MIFATAALLAAAAATPVNVADWARAYGQPTLAAPVEAAGRKLAWGRFTMELGGGQLHPVLVAGRPAGFFFTGTGKVRYVSTDPLEQGLFRRNAEKVSDYRIGADGVLEDTISEALVMLGPGLDAGLPGEGEAGPEAQKRFQAHRERWSTAFSVKPVEIMPYAQVAESRAPLVVVEIKAGRHDLGYLHDAFREQRERIGVLKPIKNETLAPGVRIDLLAGRRSLTALSSLPLGRGWLDQAPAPWVLRSVDATLVNPQGARAEVTTRQRFEARAPLRVLELSLPTRMLGNPLASPDKAWLPYRLESVTDAQGAALAYAQAEDSVLVQLPAPLQAGEAVELAFKMSGDVLHRPGGDNYWQLLGDWYPYPPRLGMASFQYHAVVKVPKPFVPFSTGSVVRRWEEGELACAEFRQDKPIKMAALLAGKYTTYTEARGPLTVRVSSYGFAKPGASKQIAGLVHAFAAFYEPLLGPFPFPELDVLEINSVGFGIAPPGTIYITREAFDPLGEQTFVKGINARLAHEVAHAWWGHVARPAEMVDRWLSESMAEYYSALAMQLRDKDELKDRIGEWKDRARKVRDWGSVFLAPYISSEDSYSEYSALLYAKGPLVLHALRLELGDQAFFTVFKSLLRSFPMKDVGTKDAIGLTNHVTKKDYGPWFERYLLGTEWPPFEKEK